MYSALVPLRCRYLLRLHGHVGFPTELLLHLELRSHPFYFTLGGFQLPHFFPLSNCVVVFTLHKELYVCVCRGETLIWTEIWLKPCQVPIFFTALTHLYFFLKKKKKTNTQGWFEENWCRVELDWPQQFFCSKTDGGWGKGQKILEEGGRIWGDAKREPRVNGGYSRRGCSITLLPTIPFTVGQGSFTLSRVTAASLLVEPEFELSAALRGRKPHSLS